jgi:hypothetical protein
MGKSFDKNNLEEVKVFFEFVKARNIMAVGEGIENNTQMLYEIKEL